MTYLVLKLEKSIFLQCNATVYCRSKQICSVVLAGL